MSLRQRIILTVAIFIALSVISITLVLGWLGRNTVIDQAESKAQSIARIVAQSARASESSAEEIKKLLTEDLTTLAFAVGQQLPQEPAQIVNQLSQITARSNLASLWLTDQSQRILAGSIGQYGIMLEGEALPDELPRAVLAELASGARFSALLGAPIEAVQYIGVHITPNRILVAGQPTSVLDPIHSSNSLPVLLQALLTKDEIMAIEVLDDSYARVAAVGEEITNEASLDIAKQTIETQDQLSFVTTEHLLVSAPILDSNGITVGVIIAALSTLPLDMMLYDNLFYGTLASSLILGLGFLGAALVGNKIARPVMAMTAAAEEVEARIFDPQSISQLAASSDEIGKLARVFQSMAIDVQNREEHLENLVQLRTDELHQKTLLLEESRKRVDAELNAARSLQAAILPQALPNNQGYHCKALMIPAKELGGDFYDFFLIDEHHLGIVIADVSGKGVAAAFFMAVSRTVLRTAAADYQSPSALMDYVNNALCAQNPHSLFVTTFYGILDRRTGELTYANAGHNPPYLLRQCDGSVHELPPTNGMALGVMEEMPYREKCITMARGDTLFLYTDGITEAMNEEGQEYSDQSLKNCLQAFASQPVEAILEEVVAAVRHFAGTAEQSDDITCLVMRYTGNLSDTPPV